MLENKKRRRVGCSSRKRQAGGSGRHGVNATQRHKLLPYPVKKTETIFLLFGAWLLRAAAGAAKMAAAEPRDSGDLLQRLIKLREELAGHDER
jgi:hypothetical protein